MATLNRDWGPWNKYPGRRSCARYQVTWYKFEQSDWFGINYHIGILVYSDMPLGYRNGGREIANSFMFVAYQDPDVFYVPAHF